ncbi:protein ninF [Salmonella enterica]|nr:protein ninF [Salmonella enterica]EAY7871197.1 protein ninF [Salmonella enterica]ECC6013217.1 protein ninF [Salmonella enterica]
MGQLIQTSLAGRLPLTCANCGQKLHVLEVHVCEHCCAELMSNPNSSMYEEEDDG